MYDQDLFQKWNREAKVFGRIAAARSITYGGVLKIMRVTRLNDAGQQLKAIREKLLLKYRDVTEASQRIARQYSNTEFAIGLSRLADIENKGTVPSLYRLYSLGVIYGVDLDRLLEMYGVQVAHMPGDSMRLGFPRTRQAGFQPDGKTLVEAPVGFDIGTDLRNTSYVSRQLHRWGKLPILLLQSFDLRKQRYAFIGTEDWSMHPMIRPGSFVQIDEAKRHIKRDVWKHDYERPIYFLEHRRGFRCGWCNINGPWLIVQSHPASSVPPEIFRYPGDIDVIGQVIGVAMRLDPEKRHRISS